MRASRKAYGSNSFFQSYIKKFLTKLQKNVQHLGSPHTDGTLKRCAGKGMLNDKLTRWGSSILMRQRLVGLKAFVQDLGSHEFKVYKFGYCIYERPFFDKRFEKKICTFWSSNFFARANPLISCLCSQFINHPCITGLEL